MATRKVKFGDLKQGNDDLIFDVDLTPWKRIDTLTAPMLITATSYAERNVVPLTEKVKGNCIYAAEFMYGNTDGRSTHMVFWGTTIPGLSAGYMLIGINEHGAYGCQRAYTNEYVGIGFYNKLGTELPLYVSKIFKVSE